MAMPNVGSIIPYRKFKFSSCMFFSSLVRSSVSFRKHVNLIYCRHIRGKVLIALADGTVAIFRRKPGMCQIVHCVLRSLFCQNLCSYVANSHAIFL